MTLSHTEGNNFLKLLTDDISDCITKMLYFTNIV